MLGAAREAEKVFGAGAPAAASEKGRGLGTALWACRGRRRRLRSALGQEKAEPAQELLPRPPRRAGPAPRPDAARSSLAGAGRALSPAEKGPRFESGRAAGRPLPRPRRRGGGMRGQCAICHRRVAPRPGAPPRALIYAECALEDLDVDFVFLCQSQVKRNSWPEFLAPIIN